MQGGLVSTDWLADNLSAPDLKVVDASWHLPDAGRDAVSEFRSRHIPGAVHFDIDKVADRESPHPHMLPPPEQFASHARRLGLGDGNRIVIYDSVGMFSAARVWWMFRVHGHRETATLDGGLPKWIAEGRPVDDLPTLPSPRHFTPRLHWQLVRNIDQVAAAAADGSEQIVDARAAARFRGEVEEPRQGLRRGHVPGSKNLPYADLLAADGCMRDREEIRNAFERIGVDLSRPVITTCGSGVTAAILSLALHRVGHPAHALYDGSWTEWGSDATRPVET